MSRNEKHENLISLLADLETLRQAEYVVCTFSSNIGRLLQSIRDTPVETVVSLDKALSI